MAAEVKTRLMQWWQARHSRERRALAAGAGVLLFLLLYGVIYAPIEAARGRLSDRLPHLRAEYRLLTAQVEEIERLRRSSAAQPGGEGSLHGRIESSAMSSGLSSGIISLSPAGNGLVRVVTAERSVEDWMSWIFELQQRGVRVHSARIRFSESTDQARLEITFAGVPP